MQFMHGHSFDEWLKLSLGQKLRLGALAVAPLIAVTVILGLVIGYGDEWFKAWRNHRKLSSLAGMQYQRPVDGSLGTDYPYRYVFDKCLSPMTTVSSTGYTELSCKGNVRVLASNDAMLGRGDTIIPLRKDGSELTIGIEYGDLHETVDRNDLREQ